MSEKAKKKPQELKVFTQAKKLCEYAFVITKNAPKQCRWNVVDKFLNANLDLVELLYIANDTWDSANRESVQRQADTKIKFISWVITIGQKLQVFTNHQTKNFGELILETRKLLWAWIKGSDSS